LVFFALYFVGVIALHKGLRPITETAGLIHDFLPERSLSRALPEAAEGRAEAYS
jgi:hypothetical protein